jgi:alkylglycerol monooxygenase
MILSLALLAVEYITVLLEFLYSKIKKDEVYTKKILITNIITGIITEFLFYLKTKLFFLAVTSFLITTSWFRHGAPLNENFTVISFLYCLILLDFAYYVFHRMDHSYKILWILHRVHHSDTTLNYSTALRVSWFEQVFFSLFLVPLFLLGFNPIIIFLAGIYLDKHQFICHGNYLQLPHFLNYIFITPSNHRIHHAQEKGYQNANFGGVFSVWDRLFNTYIDTANNITIGVGGYENNKVLDMQFSPIIKYIKKVP